ncbi:MAG: ROK family protein [Oscillospiraceae bacterium]|nr:ROK family protein [Oscillospiraceae bacterium]
MGILVFDIGGTAIKYGLVSEDFEILESNEMPTANEGEEANAKTVLQNLSGVMAEYQGKYDAIGISTAGQVDFERGYIVYGTDNIPGFSDTDMRGIFESRFGVPVAVDNDVNCAGLGEARFGAGRGSDYFICLTYGTGVGGAIYLNGDILRGAKSAAGEFGHMLTHAGGAECTCGRKGCYEAYASCRALTDRVSEHFGRYVSGREIFEPEKLEHPFIKQALDDWENEIVNGLVSLSYIFNPPLIVLGGGIMSEELLVNHIREKLISRVGVNYQSVKLEKAQLRNKAGMLGAAYIAKQRLDSLK